MTLRHLNIFVSVYEYNSITKAADALHIAQPSVSLVIKELEEYSTGSGVGLPLQKREKNFTAMQFILSLSSMKWRSV